MALLIALAFSLAGCSTGDPEADAFFQKGWLNPKELDGPPVPPMKDGVQGAVNLSAE